MNQYRGQNQHGARQPFQVTTALPLPARCVFSCSIKCGVMKARKTALVVFGVAATATLFVFISPTARAKIARMAQAPQLSPPFAYQVLTTSSEAPLALRLFETAV